MFGGSAGYVRSRLSLIDKRFKVYKLQRGQRKTSESRDRNSEDTKKQNSLHSPLDSFQKRNRSSNSSVVLLREERHYLVDRETFMWVWSFFGRRYKHEGMQLLLLYWMNLQIFVKSQLAEKSDTRVRNGRTKKLTEHQANKSGHLMFGIFFMLGLV